MNHFAPEETYVLIDNEYWDGNAFVTDGTTVIPLSEYASWCTNSYPKIHRASFDKGALELLSVGAHVRKTRSDKGKSRHTFNKETQQCSCGWKSEPSSPNHWEEQWRQHKHGLDEIV